MTVKKRILRRSPEIREASLRAHAAKQRAEHRQRMQLMVEADVCMCLSGGTKSTVSKSAIDSGINYLLALAAADYNRMDEPAIPADLQEWVPDAKAGRFRESLRKTKVYGMAQRAIKSF